MEENKFYELQKYHLEKSEILVEKRNEILKELIEKVDKLTEAVIRLRKD